MFLSFPPTLYRYNMGNLFGTPGKYFIRSSRPAENVYLEQSEIATWLPKKICNFAK